MRTTAAPYTESRLAHLVQNKCVGFPVVEHLVRGDVQETLVRGDVQETLHVKWMRKPWLGENIRKPLTRNK